MKVEAALSSTAEQLFSQYITSDLQRRVGLRYLYPFSVVSGLRCSAYANLAESIVVLGREQHDYSRRRIEALYLHEVGHIVARNARIDDDPTGRTHNRFFACLVAVMYRRTGLLDRLTIYDFGDTYERQGWQTDDLQLPPDDELVERFHYAITRSAQLAPRPQLVEEIADVIRRRDCEPSWIRASLAPKMPRWLSWLGIA